MKYLFATFVLYFTLSSCNGQSTNYERAVQLVMDRCPTANIIEVEETEDGYVEIDYLCDGTYFEVGIKENVLVLSERKVSIQSLPMDKIHDKLRKKYPGWFLDEISEVTANDTTFLKAEIIRDGIEQNVYFTSEGKWFKLKMPDVNEIWDFTKIKSNKNYHVQGYDFMHPSSIYELPELLNEISGHTKNHHGEILAVQDEIGAIFVYTPSENKIVRIHRFTDFGDFEDIALNGSTAYILRSDGKVFLYDLTEEELVSELTLPVNALDVEGLFFENPYLYIACKDALVSHANNKRIVYRAHMDNLKKLDLFLEIETDELNQFVLAHFPEIGDSPFVFNPSAVALHPITGETFVLSAADRLLAVYNDNLLINVIPLPSEIYYKPEGLSFDKNGDLLISSEGEKHGFIQGSIFVLPYTSHQ